MLSHSPSSTAGNELTATSRSKNVSRTRGQPGAEVIASHPTVAKTTVDSSATSVDRRVRERR